MNTPNGKREVPEEITQKQIRGIKLLLDQIAGFVYAPHHTPEDDAEMEALVTKHAQEVFEKRRNMSKVDRLIAQITAFGKLVDEEEEKLKKEAQRVRRMKKTLRGGSKCFQHRRSKI